MANYQPTNTRSGNVLRRLGFVEEGYGRDYLRLNDEWQDHVMTVLTNPQWTPESWEDLATDGLTMAESDT